MDNNHRPTTPTPPSSGSTGVAAERSDAGAWSEQGPRTGTSATGSGATDSASHSASQGVSQNASQGFAQHGDEALDRVVKGAHQTVDRFADTAAPHVQRLKDGAEGLRQTRDEWSDSLRTTVRENPLAAVATALALGVVVAKLTS